MTFKCKEFKTGKASICCLNSSKFHLYPSKLNVFPGLNPIFLTHCLMVVAEVCVGGRESQKLLSHSIIVQTLLLCYCNVWYWPLIEWSGTWTFICPHCNSMSHNTLTRVPLCHPTSAIYKFTRWDLQCWTVLTILVDTSKDVNGENLRLKQSCPSLCTEYFHVCDI